MARIVAMIPDLMFGSRVQASLVGAGHEVELVSSQAGLRDRFESGAIPVAEVLVVDLTDAELDGPALVEALVGDGTLAKTRTLGFYAHVDTSMRERAERAGFDQVVPRSRMAREGSELVRRLVDR